MGLTILIAERNEVLRVGLRAIFADDPRISNVSEVANERDLRSQLFHHIFDIVIVNQDMITEITGFSLHKCVVLASEPKMAVLEAAYKQGALGYLSVNVPIEILRAVLRPMEASFLIEPTFAPWIMDQLFEGSGLAICDDALTRREREVISLLREGHDRPSIARKLSIAEVTLKTHIKNIVKKLDNSTHENSVLKREKFV